jgi:6-phosphogluconolactonase (cycloisomerase 2 family)
MVYKAGYAGGLVLALLLPLSALAGDGPVGAVYTISNAAESNTILMFDRDQIGKLKPAGEFDTGGLGTGAGPGNQGGHIIDPANRWLFVVNAGKDSGPLDMAFSNDGRNLYTLNGQSDTIGVFKVKDKGGLAMLNSHIDVPASANGLAVR